MAVYPLLVGLALVACSLASQLCTTTSGLEKHLLAAFSHKRSFRQQQDKDQTLEYISDFFGSIAAQLGGETYNHTFEKVEEDMTRQAINAVLILKGLRWGTNQDQVSLLGTHYDTVTGSPGVDDNGAACSAMLEVINAISLAGCARHNSIIFVMFDWEEYALSGSKAFVYNHLIPAILERNGIPVGRFTGAFILDSILDYEDEPNTQIIPAGFDLLFPEAVDKIRAHDYAGDFISSIGRENDRELMNLIQRNFNGSADGTQRFRVIDIDIPFSGRPSESPIAPLMRDLFRSDHYHFWDYDGDYSDVGLKAVFLTDSTQFRGYMRTCYHRECDNLQYVTPRRLQFVAATTNALTNSLLELATGRDLCRC